MKNHHRIWDTPKQLLHTLVELKEKFLYKCDNSIERLNCFKQLFHRSEASTVTCSRKKIVYSLDVRNHHRIWDAQKHLLHKLVKLKKKLIYYFKMNVTIKKNAQTVSNINSIEVRLQQRLAVKTNRPLTRCENSSQHLGCIKTPTSHTC